MTPLYSSAASDVYKGQTEELLAAESDAWFIGKSPKIRMERKGRGSAVANETTGSLIGHTWERHRGNLPNLPDFPFKGTLNGNRD